INSDRLLEVCEAEMTSLERLKARSKRRRIPSNGIGGRHRPEHVQPTFMAKHERQLAKLAVEHNELSTLCNSVDDELRVALAEGELDTKLLTDDGREYAIDKSRWRASDGL